MMTDMPATADTIRSLRRDNGLTQEDLAARAGCGIATIQRAEAGKPISAASLASIAAALNVPASTLTAEVGTHFEPYLPLNPIETGRTLVSLLLGVKRIDFGFCELNSLADAEIIQSVHDMCHDIASLATPLPPIVLVTREIEARDQLAKLSAAGFCIGGATYDITAYDVDEDDGSGGFCYGQWDERHAAVRVARKPEAVTRAHVLRNLGKYESVNHGALVEPPRQTAEIDWRALFDAPSEGSEE